MTFLYEIVPLRAAGPSWPSRPSGRADFQIPTRRGQRVDRRGQERRTAHAPAPLQAARRAAEPAAGVRGKDGGKSFGQASKSFASPRRWRRLDFAPRFAIQPGGSRWPRSRNSPPALPTTIRWGCGASSSTSCGRPAPLRRDTARRGGRTTPITAWACPACRTPTAVRHDSRVGLPRAGAHRGSP